MKCDFCGQQAPDNEETCSDCKKQITLIEENNKEVEKVYGKERAKNANVGWGSGDGFIETKVYGDPCMIVITTSNDDGTFTHEHVER